MEAPLAPSKLPEGACPLLTGAAFADGIASNIDKNIESWISEESLRRVFVRATRRGRVLLSSRSKKGIVEPSAVMSEAKTIRTFYIGYLPEDTRECLGAVTSGKSRSRGSKPQMCRV